MAENTGQSRGDELAEKAKHKGEHLRQTVVSKTGYEPADLLEAPVKPPELKNTRRRISNRQFASIAIGAIIAVVGLIVWAAYFFWVGMLLVLLGVALIVLAVLVRI